ncbi:PepSY-like domain-containing protein [Flavobacteriaceae bacterium KMM 6897]|nr:PepSY-like domain-containing protein [Flavobacteriaceae bacterium KMM 6897]
MALSLLRMFRNKGSNVSPFVLVSFSSKFPKATHVLWQQMDVLKWQVNFMLKKERCTALFNSDGKWLESVTIIPPHKLPELLLKTLEEKYKKEGQKQIYHVQTPDRSHYEMNLNKGIHTIKLLFDLSGKIVGKLIL